MAKNRDNLPRLNIPQPMNHQPPMPFDRLPPMFSPAFNGAFPQPYSAMQTPMQAFFAQQPQPGPGRPTHHQGQASMAQLAAAGIHPPAGFAITPMAGHFSRASLALPSGQQPGPPFPNRNRRQLSVGGPPKAVLGGPARKLSPLPSTATPDTPAAVAVAAAPTQKAKKVNVNLPKETIPGDGQPDTRPSWARNLLDHPVEYKDLSIPPVEIYSAESYPPDSWRLHIPNAVDVFLPGKIAWEEMRQQAIEEKLEKLGVERGSGSNVPHIFAPHARAASISSPADPALLLFKLNKLQQSQDSAPNSLTTSPQPPFGLSPSPHRQPPRFVPNRHGHSMSLAQPPSYHTNGAVTNYNPFGPNAILGSDQFTQADASEPTGTLDHLPAPSTSLAPPPISAVSRSDFIRGFGLDIPEEPEEEERAESETTEDVHGGDDAVAEGEETDMDETEGEIQLQVEAGDTPHSSRLHSRHVSKLSAALTLRSVGGVFDDSPTPQVDGEPLQNGVEGELSDEESQGQPDDNEAAIEEWTGSEDMQEVSDDESIGEWSNPSDEERARQIRATRRIRRRESQQIPLDEIPRRLPNFPRPPENTMIVPPRIRDEDDIISNPSDDDHFKLRPAAPHSRTTSAQLSVHDPAKAHSRVPSEGIFHASQPSASQSQTSQSRIEQPAPTFAPRRDSLNPLAKPFVFGAPRAQAWETPTTNSSPGVPPMAPFLGHTRLPSFGKPLNIAAPEFKPGGFTFQPPPGLPQMPSAVTFPEPDFTPPDAPDQSSPFRVQGREKRQRRASSNSVEEGDSMASFRFPNTLDSPQSVRRNTSPRREMQHKSLNPSAEPFTFAGFSAVAKLPYVPKPVEVVEQQDTTQDSAREDEQVDVDEPKLSEFTFPPSASKTKRAPIPLDFTQAASNNTGVFKAPLNGTEDRTRRAVRSRLSSHDLYEHIQRPSMDDLNLPHISHKASRGHLATDPHLRQGSPLEDVFSTSKLHSRRRSSLPDALHDPNSSVSETSIVQPLDLTGRLQINRLESLLDDKIGQLRNDLRRDLAKEQVGLDGMNPSTESAINEVISLFRAQLQESASRGLDDAQLQARGELDFELLRDVVEQGHKESLTLLRHELDAVISRMWQLRSNGIEKTSDPTPVIEQVGNRTIQAVVESISQLSARLEAMNRTASSRERDAVVDKVINALTPTLQALRAEPVDYEFLTNQLSQAVKPHITQLIDLASDKRETAGLIVDKLIPMLPESPSAAFDTVALTTSLTAEIRRALGPLDVHSFKEGVAELVVSQLDSRLAVRDQNFNVEVVSRRVADGVSPLFEPLERVGASLKKLEGVQATLTSMDSGISSSQSDILNAVSQIPASFTGVIDALAEIKTQLQAVEASAISAAEKATPVAPVVVPQDDNLLQIKATLDNLTNAQASLSRETQEILAGHQDISARLTALPASLVTATTVLQDSHADFVASREQMRRDMEDLRKQNTEYQVELSKARGAHGQIRVEKDSLKEKLTVVEGDRDRLKIQVRNLEDTVSTRATEATSLATRNAELEEGLSKALARLQASDVTAQASQAKIAELEKANRELTTERQSLKAKADSLDMQVTFANRDKETTAQSLAALQSQYDQLQSQQSQLDELHLAHEKLDALTALIGQGDSEELKELRRYRDRTKVLEGEHSALQKRFKDQEGKIANSERIAFTARQSLAQAQQRGSEWERRAKDYEAQLELVRTKLEQAEQTHSQLDSDYGVVKLQLDEREADERLAKDREAKLREQITALESKVTRLQTELEQAKTPPTPTFAKPAVGNLRAPSVASYSSPSPYRKPVPLGNGNGNGYTRPDSRASTVHIDRDEPTQRSSSRLTHVSNGSATPPTGVWDSMHAPGSRSSVPSYNYRPNNPAQSLLNNGYSARSGRYPPLGPSTPKTKPSGEYHRGSVAPPSPTPSTVSLAPTQGEDGWWS
ncbi:hypothetical protein BDN72DRAFT_829764 [Pluteus cervinus]|uniref:Uncharacterized protein n=1 Tax=Pluteus cervinus TaxID=181527 RepID=A0ACD3BEK7_9AGAR|nr:hypothetical protein BDN72DRAFT_829764 [Pluteus cervinus]